MSTNSEKCMMISTVWASLACSQALPLVWTHPTIKSAIEFLDWTEAEREYLPPNRTSTCLCYMTFWKEKPKNICSICMRYALKSHLNNVFPCLIIWLCLFLFVGLQFWDIDWTRIVQVRKWPTATTVCSYSHAAGEKYRKVGCRITNKCNDRRYFKTNRRHL